MIVLYFELFFLLFFIFFFVGITKALWSNETGKESLSKVVRRVRNHLNLSFYNNWIGTYGVISIFCDSIILRTFFLFFFLFFFFINKKKKKKKLSKKKKIKIKRLSKET